MDSLLRLTLSLHPSPENVLGGVKALIRWRLALMAFAVGLMTVYLFTLAPGLTWANSGADGGDLITAAAVLGVAHPSGYPAYLLITHLFQFLPFGTLAYRANLLSAVSAVLASVLVAVLIQWSYSGARLFGQVGGLIGGLAFGLSPILWSQAVISEVYTLHTFFVALILLSLSLSRAETPSADQPWWNRTGGLLLGIALGNHLTTVLLLPPWLASAAWRENSFQRTRLLNGLLWLALGLMVYLYVPLRSQAMPVVNWGNATTWEGFWWLISGQPYRSLAFSPVAGIVWGRVPVWAMLVIAQFGGAGLLAGLYGFFFGRTTTPRIKWLTSWILLAFSAFAITYKTTDSFTYLLPAFLAFAVWLGLGVATALERIPTSSTGLTVLCLTTFVLLLTVNAAGHLPEVDASRNSDAEVFGRAVMTQAPPQALIFTEGDRDTFSLWYFHFALKQRPDVAVIVNPMLGFTWYRDNLRATYPDLKLPAEPAGAWKAAVIAANQRVACDTYPEAAIVIVCHP